MRESKIVQSQLLYAAVCTVCTVDNADLRNVLISKARQGDIYIKPIRLQRFNLDLASRRGRCSRKDCRSMEKIRERERGRLYNQSMRL